MVQGGMDLENSRIKPPKISTLVQVYGSINLSTSENYALWKHTYWHTSNNHASVLLSHNVQYLYKLLY